MTRSRETVIAAAWSMIQEAILNTIELNGAFIKDSIQLSKTDDKYVVFDPFVGKVYTSKSFTKAFYVFKCFVTAKQCGC